MNGTLSVTSSMGDPSKGYNSTVMGANRGHFVCETLPNTVVMTHPGWRRMENHTSQGYVNYLPGRSEKKRIIRSVGRQRSAEGHICYNDTYPSPCISEAQKAICNNDTYPFPCISSVCSRFIFISNPVKTEKQHTRNEHNGGRGEETIACCTRKDYTAVRFLSASS